MRPLAQRRALPPGMAGAWQTVFGGDCGKVLPPTQGRPLNSGCGVLANAVRRWEYPKVQQVSCQCPGRAVEWPPLPAPPDDSADVHP